MRIRLAYNERDAWNQIEELVNCGNCEFLICPDLFGGKCSLLGGRVDFVEKCEGFRSKKKSNDYWINKLVEMAQEFNGSNDLYRRNK